MSRPLRARTGVRPSCIFLVCSKIIFKLKLLSKKQEKVEVRCMLVLACNSLVNIIRNGFVIVTVEINCQTTHLGVEKANFRMCIVFTDMGGLIIIRTMRH